MKKIKEQKEKSTFIIYLYIQNKFDNNDRVKIYFLQCIFLNEKVITYDFKLIHDKKKIILIIYKF